jgi:hypothetical protein
MFVLSQKQTSLQGWKYSTDNTNIAKKYLVQRSGGGVCKKEKAIWQSISGKEGV